MGSELVLIGLPLGLMRWHKEDARQGGLTVYQSTFFPYSPWREGTMLSQGYHIKATLAFHSCLSV